MSNETPGSTGDKNFDEQMKDFTEDEATAPEPKPESEPVILPEPVTLPEPKENEK